MCSACSCTYNCGPGPGALLHALQVLAKPDHVIPGIPLFWVVAKGTPYRKRFLEGST